MRREDKETRELIDKKMNKCLVCNKLTKGVCCEECAILDFSSKLKKLKELADNNHISDYIFSKKIEDVTKHENNLSWERIGVEGV